MIIRTQKMKYTFDNLYICDFKFKGFKIYSLYLIFGLVSRQYNKNIY